MLSLLFCVPGWDTFFFLLINFPVISPDKVVVSPGLTTKTACSLFVCLFVCLFTQEPSGDLIENCIQPNFQDLGSGKKEVFPILDSKTISQFIKEEETLHTETFPVKASAPLIVPCGNSTTNRQQHYIPSRKLEVLKDCVSYIFENKISEARKVCCSRYL